MARKNSFENRHIEITDESSSLLYSTYPRRGASVATLREAVGYLTMIQTGIDTETPEQRPQDISWGDDFLVIHGGSQLTGIFARTSEAFFRWHVSFVLPAVVNSPEIRLEALSEDFAEVKNLETAKLDAARFDLRQP
jgi:hypothetical protein